MTSSTWMSSRMSELVRTRDVVDVGLRGHVRSWSHTWTRTGSELTCQDRVVEEFGCWVQVDHLDGPVQGPAVLDHGGAVGALEGPDKKDAKHARAPLPWVSC